MCVCREWAWEGILLPDTGQFVVLHFTDIGAKSITLSQRKPT